MSVASHIIFQAKPAEVAVKQAARKSANRNGKPARKHRVRFGRPRMHGDDKGCWDGVMQHCLIFRIFTHGVISKLKTSRISC